MKLKRSVAHLGSLALLGTFGLSVWTAPPAHAGGDTPDGYASFVSKSYAQDYGGDLPECGSRNINGHGGTNNNAKWSVGSTLKENAIVEVGDTWKVTATVWGFSSGSAPNDGPDPLILETVPTGPVARDGSIVAKLTKGNQYAGDGWVGPVAATGDWGYKFDSNSSPNGLFEPGDGANVAMTITMRATAPGVVALPLLRVRGYDATPKGSSFDCTIPVGWTWGVDKDEPPTSGTDLAFFDASYGMDTLDDANGGSHGVRIDVLKDDDDPEEDGGPGDTSEVRIKDWQPKSQKGGNVSCGTADQKGKGSFGTMSVGPCTYTPPQGFDAGLDKFGYVLRSVTGLETWVEVLLSPKPNNPPTFGDETVIGVAPGTPSFLDLSNVADDPDGDTITCIPGVVDADGTVDGFVTIDPQCDAQWTPAELGSGSASFPVRVCDSHKTFQNGSMGDGVTRAPGYDEGSPDDTSATTSSRCSDGVVKLTINKGIYSPPNAGNDSDIVDAWSNGEAFRLLLDVTANDVDVNGPDPSSEDWTGTVGIASQPDPDAGTVEVVGKKIRFTPAKGWTGPVWFKYRVCEDPAQQSPPYADNPDTPQYNEGLPLCGIAQVKVMVYGNSVPFPKDDETVVSSEDVVVDFDVSTNDFEAQGEDLVCTAGKLAAFPGLIESASIDKACLADVTPAPGSEGVATFPYEVCDVHLLQKPKWPAYPYGSFLHKPGDAVHLCSTADLKVTIVRPADAGPAERDPAPECVDDVRETGVDQAIKIDVLTNDTDDGPLTITGVGYDAVKDVTAQGGTVTVQDDVVLYTPKAGFTGQDTFDYSAQDSVGQGCAAVVTVYVRGAGNGGGGGSDPGEPGDDGSGSGDEPGDGGSGDEPGDGGSGNEPGDGSGDGSGSGSGDGSGSGSGSGDGSSDSSGYGSGSVSGGTTNGAGEGEAGPSSGTLPRTGSVVEIKTLLTLSALLLLSGAGVLRVTRRRS